MFLLDDHIAQQSPGVNVTADCQWHFEGYRSTPTGIYQPAGFFVDGVFSVHGVFDTIGTNDNPEVTGLNDIGEYVFSYICTIGDCIDGALLIYQVSNPEPSLSRWYTCKNDCNNLNVFLNKNNLNNTAEISYIAGVGGANIVGVTFVDPSGSTTISNTSFDAPFTGVGRYYALVQFDDGCIRTLLNTLF